MKNNKPCPRCGVEIAETIVMCWGCWNGGKTIKTFYGPEEVVGELSANERILLKSMEAAYEKNR